MPASRAHVLPEDRATSPAVSDASSLTSHLAADSNSIVLRTQTSPSGRTSPVILSSRASPSRSSLDSQINTELSPYGQLLHDLHHDERWLKEVTLGKRVGLYRFRGELGSGNFSQVKLAVHQLTRERVAIKLMDKNRLDEKTRKMLAREIATMEALRHPNIVRLYEVVETYTKIHLVTEYASGGELYSRVSHAGRLSEKEAKPIFAQLVSAVNYMHERNFIHRDLKAENVLFAGPGCNVKVVDMGFSTKLSTSDQRLSTFCGSPPYAAPELFRDEWYTGAPVDIWALGVLLYFMVSGSMPFRAHTVASLKKHILDGEFPDPDPPVSVDCLNVIRGLLKPSPSDRMPLMELSRDGNWLTGEPAGLTSTNAAAANESLATEIDIEAKKQLEKLGITESLLQESKDKGARSAVTGAYRIIAHRVEKELTGINENDDAQTSISTETRTSPTKQGILKRVLKTPKNGISRTCTLI